MALAVIPIRWRLTIFHAITTLVIAVLLVLGVFLVLIRAEESQVGDRAEIRAREAARLLESSGSLTEADLERMSGAGVQIVVRDAQGNIIPDGAAAPPERIDEQPPVWQQALDENGGTGETISVRSTMFPEPNPEMRTYERVYVYAVPVSPAGAPDRVIEAHIPYDSIGSSLLPVAPLAGLAVLVSLLAIGGSYSLARRAFAPVNAIVESTREITESNLSRRLPVKSRRDEISRLAMTFNDLLARLEVAFNEREEILAQQRRFVADASHELRTPLTSILGYARLLKNWGLENPETARESAQAIEDQANRMYRLVAELLLLARGDEAADINLEPVDLREIATRAVESVSVTVNGNLSIELDTGDAPVLALADPDLIYQVAMILVDNAIRYTPHGGTVTVRTRHLPDGQLLEIADTGIGIPAEHLPHLFERFYQVDRSRSSGGTGLGLAIARQIVELHNGTIDVISVSGQGSTFTIRFPRPPYA